MLVELIAVIAAGFLGGGLALIVRTTAKGLPRWLVPVAAGAAMIAVTIALEYAWFERTRATLPEGLTVALTHESQAPWRPWTYAVPFIDRFIAVDQASTRTHEAQPGQRLVNLFIFARWQPPSQVSAVFDCANSRRADVVEGVTLEGDGSLTGARWHDTGPDHPVTRIACAEATDAEADEEAAA